MRRAYSDAAALFRGELPPGVLDFDLITPHRDTYKTRLDPMGATFHSAARPWVDTHDTSSVKKVLGAIEGVTEQSPDRFRVRVRFDMDKPEAAEAYRQHKAGFLKGCSVGFDPIEGATHIEVPKDGGAPCDRCDGTRVVGDGQDCMQCFGTGSADAVLVYDKFYILEGSSCATPSNPMALCVRSIEDGMRAARKIAKFSGEDNLTAATHHEGWDIEEEDAFLAMFPDAAGMTLTQLEAAAEKFNAATRKRRHVLSFARRIQLRMHHPEHVQKRSDFAFTSGVFPMMKPEHRGMYRYAVGDHMRMAGDHLDMMAATDHPELRKFHREAAQASMNRAGHMVRMIADSMAAGHEDAPEDAALIGSMMRAAPANVDADVAAEWTACQRAALPHAEQTFADVGAKLAKSPMELRTRWAAMESVNAAHKKMLGEQRSAAAKTEDAERRALVLDIAGSAAGLEPALEAQMLGFDPVAYVRDGKENVRAARPWSLEQIRTYRLQVEGAVAQVTRTAPLRQQSGAAAQETTLTPPQPQTRGAQLDPQLGAVLDMVAQRGGIDPKLVRAMAQSGAHAVEDASMNKRIAERQIKPLSGDGVTVVNEMGGQPADRRFQVRS